MVLVKTRKHRQRHCLELDAISDFPIFRFSKFPIFQVSKFPSFQVSKFPSFQLLSAQISKLFL